MELDLVCEDRRWADLGLEDLAHRAVTATVVHIGLDPGSVDVSLLGCDDARICVLNAEFRDKAVPTNVLSWPAQEIAPPDLPAVDPFGSISLGDMALGYDTCHREALEQGKSLADHATHLIVHATLHLLGYDHIRDIDATIMERLEVEILGKLGLPDPYSTL